MTSRVVEAIAAAPQEIETLDGLPHFDLIDHLNRQIIFSLKAFGPGPRTKGICDHITKELVEVQAAPKDLGEWIDVIMLGLDGAWRAGYIPEQIAAALADKLSRNAGRTWPDWRTSDPDKAIEHDRTMHAGLRLPGPGEAPECTTGTRPIRTSRGEGSD